jgi:hypothetical protein
VAQAALKYLFPLPNTGPANAIANNYSVNFPTPLTSNQGDFRVDQNFGGRQTAFVRGTPLESSGQQGSAGMSVATAGYPVLAATSPKCQHRHGVSALTRDKNQPTPVE